MKNTNAVSRLLKDLATLALGYAVMWIFLSIGGNVSGADQFLCVLCSGVILGYRVANHIIGCPIGLLSIVMKFILAIVIGIPAAIYTIIRDIIGVVRERKSIAAGQM